MPKYLLIAFISAVVFLLGLIVIKQRRTLPHITGFLLCVFSALSLIFLLGREWSIDRNQVPLPWNNFFDAAVALQAFAAVSFALSFPTPSPHFKMIFIPLAVIALIVAGNALTGGNFSKHEIINHIHVIEPSGFYSVYVAYSLTTMTVTIWTLLWKYRRIRTNETDDRAKNALRIILVGFSLSIFIGYFFSVVQPILLNEIRYFYLLSVAFLVGAFSAFYAIVKYSAFDIETVIHKTLSWLFLSSVPLVVSTFAASWLRPLVADASTWRWAFVIGGMSSLIGLYLYTAQPYIDQLFDRRKYDLRKTLDETIRDLAVLQDLQPMAQKALDQIFRVLSLQSASALILDPDRKQLLPVAVKNHSIGDSISMPSAVLETLQEGTMLEMDQIRQTNGREEKEDSISQWFKEQGFVFCLPLIQNAELIGVIALGRKRNLQPLTVREKTFLAQIGAAATISFSNSLLLERVRELDRLKTEFLSEVAHELRVPLLGMSSIADGILTDDSEDLPGNRKKMIGNIRETAVEMKDLVDHLLDLSKIEMGVMTYDFREIDVGSVVRLAMDLAGGAIASKGLELAVQMDEPLPTVKGDKSRIRQCVTNLLSNAVKYTDHGTIRVSCVKAEGGVQVVVEDTGRGMSQEEIRSLFTRYRRGDQVSGIEGSGLGLALTKEIVEAHRGRIDVESESGQGTRISIFLPEKQPEALQPDPAPPTGRAADPNGKRTELTNGTKGSLPRAVMGHGETLLIADDSEIDRDVLQSFFEANGYRIITAANGREALQRIREEVPDLIITDMIMPNFSGPQLCRMLKDNLNTASIPIIMVTARDNLGEMAFGFEWGADDYASKPCNLKELSLRVTMLLRINRIRNDLETARSRLIEMELIASSSGTLVHAIKVPLALIQNYVKIVRSEFVSGNSEKVHEGFSQISEAAEDIAGILHGLRRAHIDPPKMVRVDLAAVVEACIADRTEEISKPSYRIVKRYGENIPRVQGDQAQLGMAFANLIANAFDAMPDGGTLEVILSMVGLEGVEIKIRDSGAGIPESVRKNLFKPFITTKAHGTGLGLWTAKRVIENNHGGELSLASIRGAGTAAIVRLPLVGLMKTGHQKEVIEHGERPDSDR